MDLSKVLFVGGDLFEFASNKIRCRDIATRLGCQCHFGATSADDIPLGYEVFVCVKPKLNATELAKLARRGAIVWDIVDFHPPEENVSIYLASSSVVAQRFQHLGDVRVIPHHHCNFTNRPNSAGQRTAYWIGNHTWYPNLANVPHEKFFIRGMERPQVARIFRKAGMMLNFRAEGFGVKEHVQLNSGIKLINSIGFGLPSVSSDEPAYNEIGPECTVTCSLTDCAEWVDILTNDREFYEALRRRCLAKASTYHINAIAGRYRQMLKSLLRTRTVQTTWPARRWMAPSADTFAAPMPLFSDVTPGVEPMESLPVLAPSDRATVASA